MKICREPGCFSFSSSNRLRRKNGGVGAGKCPDEVKQDQKCAERGDVQGELADAKLTRPREHQGKLHADQYVETGNVRARQDEKILHRKFPHVLGRVEIPRPGFYSHLRLESYEAVSEGVGREALVGTGTTAW